MKTAAPTPSKGIIQWVLIAICLTILIGWLITDKQAEARRNTQRWYSKNGKDCAAVIWNPRIEEWNVLSGLDKATIPTEKEAVAFAHRMCGEGELKISDQRMH